MASTNDPTGTITSSEPADLKQVGSSQKTNQRREGRLAGSTGSSTDTRKGRRLSQVGLQRTGFGMVPRRESDQLEGTSQSGENRFPAKGRLSASSSTSYTSMYKNTLRQSLDASNPNFSLAHPVSGTSSSSSVNDLGRSLSSFKFGSMGNEPPVLGTPTAELGPFEYPMNPDVEKEEEEAYRRSSGSGSLLSETTEWRSPARSLGSGLALGAELGVAPAAPGIGRLRRMSTMNEAISLPEVRRPSVVHSNTDPLVDVVDAGISPTSSSQEEREREREQEEEIEGETELTENLALHRRRATLDDRRAGSDSASPLVLPPGSITAAALGTVNLINARRQSILSFGQGGPVETPVPPRLAGLAHVNAVASPARVQATRDDVRSFSALRRGSLPMNDLRVDVARSRQQSVGGMTSVGSSRSAFARASFSTQAGPIVSNPGTRFEETTVATPYLYNRRNSLAHHYPLGSAPGSGTGTPVQVRPGLPPWQPRRMSTSESSDAASSSTSSAQTIRGWRQGSEVTTPGATSRAEEDGGASGDRSRFEEKVDEGLKRSMEAFSFGGTPAPGLVDEPNAAEEDEGPHGSAGSHDYPYARTFSSSSSSTSTSSNSSYTSGKDRGGPAQARSRPGSISAIRSGFRSARNSVSNEAHTITEEDTGQDYQVAERMRMMSAGPGSTEGSGTDSQVFCSSSSSASSTSSASSSNFGWNSRSRGSIGRPDRLGRQRGSIRPLHGGETVACPVPEIPPFRGQPASKRSSVGAWTSGSSVPSTPSVVDPDEQSVRGRLDEEEEVDALTPMTELDVEVVLGKEVEVVGDQEAGVESGLIDDDDTGRKGEEETGKTGGFDDGLYVLYERE